MLSVFEEMKEAKRAKCACMPHRCSSSALLRISGRLGVHAAALF